MKKIFTFLLALTVSVGTLFAESGTCGENLTWTLTDGVLTISGTGDMTNWSDFTEVPWYSYSASIKSAVIEDGVTGIGLGAFFNCTNLNSVKLGNNVANIKSGAFFNCTGLTSITIPGSVTYLGSQTFGYCTGLTEITCYATTPPYCDGKCFEEVDKSIPVYVPSEKVADYQKTTGWSDFTNIQAVPSGTCGKEGDNLTWMLKGGVLTISGKGEMADYSTDDTPWNDYKSDIKSVVIESGATSIGKYAFYQCGNLTAVTIPDGVASIGNSAFYNCTGLTEVIIPNSVTGIGNGVFRGCTALTSVTLSQGLTTIALRTFQDCSKLTSIVIPAGVTTIVDRAFYKCSGLTSITCKATIPPTCGNSDCFYNVDKSIPLYVPEGTVEAYQKASVWSSFTNIIDASAIASGTCGAEGDNLIWKLSNEGVLVISGTGAMADWSNAGVVPWSAYASSITSIVIKEGATSIGKNAARNCKALTSVTIPNGVNTIGEYAFGYCPELSSITIPGSVTSIGDYAFRRCSALTSIVVENGNTIYDSRDNCNAIIETATNTLIQGCQNTLIPSGVTGIGKYAFEKCTGLKAMEMPNSVTSIGDYAFYDCSDLEALSMGDSVISIGKYAFAYCSAMTYIEFPNTVTNIGNYACQSCTGLTQIISLSTTPPECGSNCFDKVDKDTPLYVPEGTKAAYKDASVWGDFTNIQELDNILASGTCGIDGDNLLWKLSYDGVLTISGTGEMANWESTPDVPWYSYASSVKSVLIEEGVTSIGDYAFAYCSGLTSATLPNGVTNIGFVAFACSGLTSIEIPNSVTSIGGYAFYYCTGLTSVTLGNSVIDISWRAFEDCVSLTDLTIPNSVKDIGWKAFSGCSGLTSVTIGNGVKNIGSDAFDRCSKLKSVHISDIVAWCAITFSGSNSNPLMYANHLYLNDSEITDLVIPNTVDSIRANAFEACLGLTSVTIPNSVTYIGYMSFWECSGLTSLTIGDGVRTIDADAFQNCRQLTSVTIPNSVRCIRMNAFSGCSALTSATIGNSVDSIDGGAFYKCTGLTEITCKAMTPPICGTGCFYSVDKSIPLYVPYGTKSAYKGADKWNEFTNIQEMECEAVSGTCGAEGDNLTWEFSCDSVLTISGTGAMADWEELKDVPWYSFVSSIKSVVLKEGITSLGEDAFAGCEKITSITIPNSVTSIGNYVFASCTALSSIEIPNSVTSIGFAAFFYCTALTAITIPNSVISIGLGAFFNCTALTSVVLPDGITSIEIQTFYECPALTSITIPDGVTSVGDGAFYGCTGLTEITCKATTPPTCGVACFNEVDKSIPLYVPAGTKAAYKEADEWKEFNIQEMTPAGTVTYELVDLSTETLTAGQYIIVFDDNKAHAAVSGKDLIASSDELTISGNVAYVPEETFCAVTIAPLGTDSFSILLADGKTYMDLQAKNSVTTSANPSAFGITDGGDRNVKIGKYLASESKTFILQHNSTSGNYFRMYSSTNYTLPKLYRKVAAPVPTGLDQITNDQSPMTNKVLRDGQVFILRDGKTYNVMGVEVR